MQPHTAPSWRPSLSAPECRPGRAGRCQRRAGPVVRGCGPRSSRYPRSAPTRAWPEGVDWVSEVGALSWCAGAGCASRAWRSAGAPRCITSARIGGRSARADLLGLFRTGVEAKFVADVNLNADRARRGLDDPDGRPSVPDRAQDRRIPGLVAACRPERPQLRVGQQLAVLADPRRGGGPGSQRRSAADPVSTTMVSALLGLPADRLAEPAARPGTGGGHPAGAPMDRCVS